MKTEMKTRMYNLLMVEDKVNSDRVFKQLKKYTEAKDEQNGFKIRPGFYLENGATAIPGGVNFTIYSQNATSCSLVLFKRMAKEPFAIIDFPEEYKIGNVYSMIVYDLDITEFEYAYIVDGEYNPAKGLLFDRNNLLIDPYAKAIIGQSRWGVKPSTGYDYRARVVSNDFNWDDSHQPHIPMKDLIIYELHVRGFTKHKSSGVKYKGTFAGIIEKIPYLKKLGVNALELMPVFEFDEMRAPREYNGKKLIDYWGYNPVSFFAPNTSYTAKKEYNREGDELKQLIKTLHDNGMEIILDVVFNHTGEGDEKDGSIFSFKGLDNDIYYMLKPDGTYFNFSGCGNTFNCNHPIVQQLILDCLRYWVTEYRVDGFRFDLASILARDSDGTPMKNPPLIRSLAFDPVLGKTKLIAEAWDAGGLYQVGSFPSWNRWSEWNGKYRDDLRCFLKGDEGKAVNTIKRIKGSPDLYNLEKRGEGASVNFITCHDGFTLYDFYSYNQKHNEANGWNGTDGDNNNNSWNCGVEGETDNPNIIALRKRMIKNAFTALLCSRGAAMFLAGDEFCNTQYGNNNPYCQDNEISWLDWTMLKENNDIFEYVKFMIDFRKNHPIIRGKYKQAHCNYPDTSVHSTQSWEEEFHSYSRVIGVMFAGRNQQDTEDDIIYLSINAYWEPQVVTLPDLPQGMCWGLVADTAKPLNKEIQKASNIICMTERSAIVLMAIKE